MLYSQNRKLYDASRDGNVSRMSELIARGAQVNYHRPDHANVSIVSGHMMLVTDPHISIYTTTHSQWLSIWFCMCVSAVVYPGFE